MSVSSVLGSRLKAFFLSNYSGGTWTSDVGTATFTQGTSGNRPTATTLPGGATALDFDGTDDSLTAGTAISLSNGGYRLVFFIVRLDGNGSGGALGDDQSAILSSRTVGSCQAWIDPTGVQGVGTGVMFWSSNSGGNSGWTNGSVADGNYYRIIALEDTGTGVTTLYVNGVAQTLHTMSAGTPSTSPWDSDLQVGRWSASNNHHNGLIAALGFAHDTSEFSGGDIAALDAALADLLVAPPDVTDPMGMAGFFGI